MTDIEKLVIYVAIRRPNTVDGYEDLARYINKGWMSSDEMIAETSYEKLKDRVTRSMAIDHDEKWFILSGNTLAEMTTPKPEFREW